jgi:hypothetical protein
VGEERNTSKLLVGCKWAQLLWKEIWRVFKKTKNRSTTWSRDTTPTVTYSWKYQGPTHPAHISCWVNKLP